MVNFFSIEQTIPGCEAAGKLPQFMFIVATRAALAAGVALLFSQRLSKVQRRAAGASLVGLGAATTLPAIKLLSNRPRPLVSRLRFLVS